MLHDKMPLDWKEANTGEIAPGYGGQFEIGLFWFSLSPDVDDDDAYHLRCTISEFELLNTKIPMSLTPAQIMRECAIWAEAKAVELKLAAHFFGNTVKP